MAETFSVTLTTNSGGAATGYLPTLGAVSGKVHSLTYTKVDFANGVDFTITSERTGETIWTQADVNASVTKAPRLPVHGTDGAAALYASGGVAVLDKIVLTADRIKIVIAQGGDTKSGTFSVTMG